MARYQVTLAYDGAGFSGSQHQGRVRTVQSVVEQALQRLGWQDRHIQLAGRTDAGVHATGQVIAFDLEWRHPAEELQRALNACLPADLAARKVALAAPGFDPRRQACSRTYCYYIFYDDVRQPVRERYAWRLWPGLALESLQQAANLLPGAHDFAAFGSPPRVGGSTVRMVMQAGWQEYQLSIGNSPAPNGAMFQVTANGFLYRMVRRMVLLMVAVAQSRLALDALAALVETPALAPATIQGLAPAQGLFLSEVCYEADGLPRLQPSGKMV